MRRGLRGSRAAGTLGLTVAGLSLVAALPVRAQEPEPRSLSSRLPPGPLIRPETTLSALLGLEVDRELEEAALAEDLARLGRWRQQRDASLDRLRNLHRSLDASPAGPGEGEGPTEPVEELERRLRDEESLLAGIGQEGRELRQRVRARRERIAGLSEKANELAALLPADVDSVTGVWDVRFTPTSEHGVLTLYQTGTLLNGEYVLGGGWHGSLEGTLVDGRVYLERIDSRKGRYASLTGLLDGQGHTIRGTWREKDLTAGRPTDGSWIAQKRAEHRPEAP